MERQWVYIQNVFINSTKNSFRKMKQIGDYTLAALNAYLVANPTLLKATADAIKNLLTMLQPLVENYDDLYVQWINSQGTQQGQTLSLKQLLDSLGNPMIIDWDIAIMNVYKPGTPQYMALLPHHRQAFQQGTQQARITAVGALSLAIGNDEALQNVKKQVDAMFDKLVTAVNMQKGNKSDKKGSSQDMETARLALGNGLYGTLGMLMYLFMNMPAAIERFFPLSVLRSPEQTEFNQTINGSETKLVFVRTVADDDRFKITAGNTIIKAALVAEKNDAMPGEAFTLQPNEEEIVGRDVLGAAGNRCLIVKNMSATEKGSFSIKIM